MNKFYSFIALCLILSLNANSQEYKNGIGIHMGAFDFYGPQTGKYGLHSQTNLVSQKNERVLLWDPAVQVSYWHAINKNLDIKLGVQVANIQYPNSSKDSNFIKAKQGYHVLQSQYEYGILDAKLNYSFLTKEDHLLSPYIGAGLSGTFRKAAQGLDVPVGVGLNIKITPGLYVNLESNYRLALTNKNQNNLSHSIGVVYWWKTTKVKTKSIPPSPLVKDADNDGVPDDKDKCPNYAGPKEKGGCPDKDNDGVYDFDDKCPNIPGLAINSGCPDSDKDGIIDSEDRCPNEAGLKSNQGCPEIKQEIVEKVNIAAKSVNFESAKAVLTEASYKQLDVIVDVLKDDPLLNIDIEGHTDNQGKGELNLVLSQERADVCKAYFMKKGIEERRITSVGFGDMKPIADNSTEEGRAQNRRTEFKLSR